MVRVGGMSLSATLHLGAHREAVAAVRRAAGRFRNPGHGRGRADRYARQAHEAGWPDRHALQRRCGHHKTLRVSSGCSAEMPAAILVSPGALYGRERFAHPADQEAGRDSNALLHLCLLSRRKMPRIWRGPLNRMFAVRSFLDAGVARDASFRLPAPDPSSR